MNRRLFLCPMLALLLAPCAVGQQTETESPTRVEILRQIAIYEAAVKEAESAHVSDASAAEMYTRLASLYENVARYDQSEAALEHAVSLLRRDPGSLGPLAEDINTLGLLHAEMGKLREAEGEVLEALKLREGVGDSLEIARSWNSLAGIYFRHRKYATARDYFRRAMDEFSVNQRASAVDRVSSQFGMAVALCAMKDCPSAIPLLKNGIDIARTELRPNDYPLGTGEYLLGLAYWRSGNLFDAAPHMERGTALMKEQLGWGHPVYLNALKQYALFLRKSQRSDDAKAVERQIRMAETVVDVHSIPTRQGVDSLAGLR
jgi:tetratricopeptide (TPR) repeat protein